MSEMGGGRQSPAELAKIDLEPLLAQTRHSAVHLELRDDCAPSEPVFPQWRAGRPVAELLPELAPGVAVIRRHAARGVRFRRARVVSEPVTEYVRFLHAITAGLNIPAGEQVRWLPRRQSSDLALPGNDFWLLDRQVVRFGIFSGDGLILGHDLSRDPAVVKLCASAFEAVWERAIPHHEYDPA